jgi:hypothetical protein
MNKPILCVGFDGVIHSYTSPWVDEVTIPDPPVPGALAWLWAATEWWDVQIYSSRSKTAAGRLAMRDWMIKHAREQFSPGHPMSELDHAKALGYDCYLYPIDFAAEKPAAFLTIDDRAVCFEGDWAELDPCELRNFKPWNKRPQPPFLQPYAA